jgi:cobalt-zinc-cadmium efflux system outer membrane protein
LGLSPRVILGNPTEALPSPHIELRKISDLQTTLIENNTKLSALRMSFWESDAELRLELAKQYPDLNLGFGFEQYPGEKTQTFEIGIGLELPIFDRNQQGIAHAVAARKATKAAYEAKLSALLTELELGVRTYALHLRRVEALDELVPLAAKNQADALRLTELGTFDFMKFLDISKAYTELTMESLEQRARLWKALIELEAITGLKLVTFQSSKSTSQEGTNKK